MTCHLLHLLQLVGGLVDQCPRSPLADNELALDVRLPKHLEQTYAVDAARSSGNPYNQPPAGHLSVERIPGSPHTLIMQQVGAGSLRN